MCQRCGFDSRWWRREDASAVFKSLGVWWRLATADLTVDDLNRRPAPGVWSALEYGLHSAMVLPILRYGIEVILAHDLAEVHDPCPEVDTEDATSPLTLEPDSIVDDLEREGTILAQLVDTCHDGWEHVGRMDDQTWWQAEATLLHAVHDTTHHFLDVGEGLARIGAALPTAESTVYPVEVSDRGTVRRPVNLVSLQSDGVEEDRQADRWHHCPPFHAVCLWPSEVIAHQAVKRHPIGRDEACEHLALSGADWPRLRPGTRVLAGTALLELSYPVEPSQDERRRLKDSETGRPPKTGDPESRRGWYAWVRQPGQIHPGDSAIISPL